MKTRRNLINIFLSTGFTLYFLYVINDSFSQFFNFPIIIKLSYLPYALFLIVFAAGLTYSQPQRYIFVKEFKPLYYLFLFAIFVMLAIGLIRKNPIYLIYPDLEGLLILSSAMIIGSSKENWQVVLKIFFVILTIGAILNFISIFSLEGLERSITEHSLVNKLQGLIFPVYFLFLLYPVYFKKNRKNIVVVSIVLLFVLSLIFQKRLTFLHVIATLLIFSYIYSKNSSKASKKYFRNFSVFLLFVFLFLLTAQILSYAGYNLSYSLDAFYNRAIGKVGFINKVEHDGRYQIAGDVIKEIFSSGNGILGYGLGGYISIPNMWYSMYIGNTLMTHSATSIEVGQTWPLWKGGLLFMLIYQYLTLKILFSVKKYKKSFFLMANWAFVLISYLFFYGEHFWTGSGNLFFLFLLGNSYGSLMAYKRFL